MFSTTTISVFLVLVGYQVGTSVCPLVTGLSSPDPIQYTTSGPESQVLVEKTEDGSGMRPIDKGLRPLYLMTEGFLNLVHPQWKGDWIDDPRFDKAFNDGDILAGVKIIYGLVWSDWKFWAGHYLGFTLVVAMGVVFVVAMPIVALVFCCCRLRGRCGAKPRRGKKNSDGLKRVAMAILLIVLTTLMAAGVVAMFMTNELLRQQTSVRPNLSDVSGLKPETGLLPSLVSCLRRIETYIFRTFEDMNDAIVVPIKDHVTLIHRQFLDFPDRTREKFKEFLDPGQIFYAAAALSGSLRDIAVDLENVDQYMDRLSQIQSQLNSTILHSKRNILSALPSSCHAECRELKNRVISLNVTVDFSQSDSTSSHVSIIRSIINDFQSLIDEGRAQYINVSNAILNGSRQAVREKVNTFLSELDRKLDDSLRVKTKEIHEIRTQIIRMLHLNDSIAFLSKTAQKPVETFGNFRYYACIGLACSLLLIIVLIYLGLCFGVCGEPAGEDAHFCNRGVGASFLMAGISFTFLFASLLMSVTIVLFLFGGASYTEVCRPALNNENRTVMKIAERILASSLRGSEFNFTILSVISECESDRSIYEALNLGETLDVMKELDQLRGLITESINDVGIKIQVNTSSIVVASKEVLDMLVRLQAVTFEDFRFSSIEHSLNQPPTNSNVTALASDLLQYSRSPILNGTQRLAMLLESERLLNMSRSLIDPMMITTRQFKEFLGKFKEKIVPRPGFPTFVNKAEDLMNFLTSTQEFLRRNLSGLISDYLVSYIGEISDSSVAFVSKVKHEVQHNVGKCRVLYEVFRTVSISTCSWFLSPFNGFWFSILWCLVLSVPSLILSVHLAALYRKTEDYAGNDSKSLDDPAWRLTLGDIHPAVQGHLNPVYDGSDDDPGSPATDLAQPLTPLVRVLSDPGFTHPLFSGQGGMVRPGHRNAQRSSGSEKP